MLQDRRNGLAAAILGLASAATVVWQNMRLTVLWDLSYILENASRIASGDVPYRGFPFPYAPATFYIQAAIIRIFGRVEMHHAIYAAVACAVATALTFVIVRRLAGSPSIALILALPLSILGTNCIFPHPFYDPDCCLAVLAVAVALISARSQRALFIAAACVPLTLLIKQNIGVGFVGGVAIWLLFSRERKTIVAGFAGLAAGGVTVLAVIAAVFGLHDYVQWTVQFAASRRLPSIALQLEPFGDPIVWYSAVAIIAGLFASRRIPILGALFIAAPWVWTIVDSLITDDPNEPQINFLRTWPIVIVVSVAAMFIDRDRDWRTRSLPLLLAATIYGVFLSQSTWGSTYGIWPLLVVLIATWMPRAPYARLSACILTATIFLGAVPYIRDSERLTYVKLDGDVRTSTLAPLRGVHIAGDWLPDFEELVRWTDEHIPRNDGIVCMPGEDLFYFTTGRHPMFPVLMFDRTVNPFSAKVIVREIQKRHIRWIIVKKTLQLNGTPMPELNEVLAKLPLQTAVQLHNYTIYQIRSASLASS